MHKLSNSIIDKMISEQLNKREVHFLLFLSFYQDDDGSVYGVYYKDICEKTGMSYQEFYNVKKSLIDKHFISCTKNHFSDYDITILDNSFLTKDDNKKGYVNTNQPIFHLKEFYQMKAGSMLLAIKLLRSISAGHGFFNIGLNKFYSDYSALFHVEKRVLRSYVKEIKQFFDVELHNGKYLFEPKLCITGKSTKKSSAESLRLQHTRIVLRRNNIKHFSSDEFDEIVTFFRQYGQTAKDRGLNIYRIIDAAIKDSLIELQCKPGRQFLHLPFIHKLIRQQIFRDYSVKKENMVSEPGNTSTPIPDILMPDAIPNTTYRKSAQKNKFNNFKQRNYDYDNLEKFLLSTIPNPV